MIKKILKINNYGKFISPVFGANNWNGTFDQTNVIYANNGSGKTTLSLLFRSIKGKDDIISKKKSFSSTEDPEIVMLHEDNKEIKFSKGKWNRFDSNTEIFDSFFIDDNVYIISLKQEGHESHIFEILLGEKAVNIKKNVGELKVLIRKLRNKRSDLRARLNDSQSSEKNRIRYRKMIDDNQIERQRATVQITKLNKELIELSSTDLGLYLDKINDYLKLFNPSLKLSKLQNVGSSVVYTLQVNGHALKTDDKSLYSLRYTLSDGDKNALSLSFFLAKLDLLPNLHDQTVVIDDPITSFDYSRKSTTINQLVVLSKKVKMFILLTHDLTFANEFSRRLSYSCNNLKIDFNGTTSYFIKHDIENESLTGVFKDLTVLHDFLKKGAVNDTERRDIARCIRPVLEGIFRIKFFREVDRTEWLGDILGKIKFSEPPSIFSPFKKILPELSEINDYSKEYHHSNPYYFETPINDEELRNYVNRTIELLRVL